MNNLLQKLRIKVSKTYYITLYIILYSILFFCNMELHIV